ncbi:NUDIX domain-containing protein [Candidatus Micrarchaeota archaeon]|nr:NUDIX domain-containing protein [Candidatus Micrarchaeota archaeon]
MEKKTIIPVTLVLLMKQNKVLLQRRCNTGFHDGLYSFPGGHIKLGETPINAAVREAGEETGVRLDLAYLELVHVMYLRDQDELIAFFFKTERMSGQPKIMESSKCSDLAWFDTSQLPKDTAPHIRQAMDCILQKKLYSEYEY